MAAFARRVALNPALHAEYGDDAIGLITATIETFEAFRPELYLIESDPHAYFTVPLAYQALQCRDGRRCNNYRDLAGKPLPYNQNLSMMKALAELARAADSALYRRSVDATPEWLRMATEEIPSSLRRTSPSSPITFARRRSTTAHRISSGTTSTRERASRIRGTVNSSWGAWPPSSRVMLRSTRSSLAPGEANGSVAAILRADRQHLSPQSLAGQLAQAEGGRVGRRIEERRVRRLGPVFAVRSLGVETESRHRPRRPVYAWTTMPRSCAIGNSAE